MCGGLRGASDGRRVECRNQPADRDGALRGESGPALRQPRYHHRFAQ
jgi:hypothetical protein